MESRIQPTMLVRRSRYVIGRVLSRRDPLIVERDGRAAARPTPLANYPDIELGDLLHAWVSVAPVDDCFADVLERVNNADRPQRNPWH